MKLQVIVSAILILGFNIVFSQNATKLLRFPTIYNNNIVFCYAGDIYSANAEGGIARKLTSHEGNEMFPKISPNGKLIAFTAQYDGNTEVYVMPIDGGTPKRLTFTATLKRDDVSDRMGPNNIVMSWTNDSKYIIYRSRKQSFNDFVGQLFKVPVDGGMSEELPLPTGGFCSYSLDGEKLAFNRVFREFRTWKYYKGGMADDVWIYNFKTKQTENITSNVSQDIIPMWYKDKVFYISDRDRIMNLFEYNTTSKETKKVTFFDKYDIKFPSINGNKIIFENEGELYIFNTDDYKYKKISIQVSDDQFQSRELFKDASKNITNVTISPDGNRLVVSARGDIFTVPVKSGITRNLTQSSDYHDRDAVWSPDGKYIAFISDISGEFEIYLQDEKAKSHVIKLTSNSDTYKYSIKWSPDSKKILWTDKKLRLNYIDIDTKVVTIVDNNKTWEINSTDWSPDSKWIAYGMDSDNKFSVIYLYNLQSKKRYELTENWYESFSPSFSSDGKYLYFISKRDYNPIYSETEWNHAYKDMDKIFCITLDKSAKSPVAPENNEVKFQEKSTTVKQNPSTTSKDIIVDIENIKNRITSLPIKAGKYWNIHVIDSSIYFMRNSAGDKPSLYLYDLKTDKEKELTECNNYQFSFDNKKMLISKGGKFYIIDKTSSEIKLEKEVDLSNLKLWVDVKKEWTQIYNESWRQMRDFFYVENMHGVDWSDMKAKYEVFLPYVNNRYDLSYIIGELIGELNVGHAYVGGGDKTEIQKIELGLLGAKISKDKSGYFKIEKILKGKNWDKNWRSPLTEIGINVKEGDFIIAIDGYDLKNTADIYEKLVGKANKQIELKVNKIPSAENATDYIIVPISDEANLYYLDWVEGNIQKVDKATNGQVGYIHVPDMVTEGLNEFVKYFYPQLNKKALIIDDRGNGGGNVSPMLLERLSREVTRANMSRNVSVPSTIPRQMILGPKVLLINNYSASDGDLFPYGFKKHQLGKVIGVRSWGGVVGIRGSLPFIDGGTLHKPEFASYSSEESKWIIEGYGVDPDIIIDNDPAKEYSGIDEQLNKAIEVILDELKNNSQSLPNIPEAPDKSK